MAKATSDNVPHCPPTAITASPDATTAKLRMCPRPVATAWSTHSFASARSRPGRMPIVVPPACFRAARRRGHDLSEPARDDLAPAFGEQAAHLLGAGLVLRPASDHRHLHAAMVEARHARGGTLVLGGGFAGSYVARLLGKRGATIVSLENFMLFTPLLPEAASGTLEPRHVVVPLRVMCPHSELLLGRLTALDTRQKTATVVAGTDTLTVHYADAVLALGSFARSLPIPGLAEHGLGFKDLADAIHLRNHVLRQLELAAAERDRQRAEAHLTFVFVGAGYAGVEALAELSDLVRDAMRYYPEFQRPRARWVLVDAAPKILPEIPSRLGDYAAEQLAGRGVEIHTSTTLASVGPGTSRSRAASVSPRTRSCGQRA